MKIGIATVPTVDAPAPALALLARMIEDRGLESLWFAEHSHLTAGLDRADGGDGDPYAKTFDAFVAMTAAAATTARLRVATGVCLVPQRDPIQTTKEIATVHVISGGRVTFGFGAGPTNLVSAGSGSVIGATLRGIRRG
jgi:alkanesulfonate monooxygenase SsuD/methylene tetrahydromethanopterin reductase-like flavin-dependent oxidoreductase (luciferase family)